MIDCRHNWVTGRDCIQCSRCGDTKPLEVERNTRKVLADLHREHRDAMRAIAILSDAVKFYADPATYHAIAFLSDPPAGEFVEDFSYDEDYGRDMPGKRGREAVKRFNKIVEKYRKEGEL